MKIEVTTPKQSALKELGERLARTRKQQGFTQSELSREAGIGVATLRRIEDGKDAQLGSWIKLLKALGMTGVIDHLVPEELVSPMAEVRGTRRGKKPGNKAREPRWGDER